MDTMPLTGVSQKDEGIRWRAELVWDERRDYAAAPDADADADDDDDEEVDFFSGIRC